MHWILSHIICLGDESDGSRGVAARAAISSSMLLMTTFDRVLGQVCLKNLISTVCVLDVYR